MATTYTPITTYTVSGTSQASIDFSSISNQYTDIVAIASIRGTAALSSTDLLYVFNGVRSNIYDGFYINGSGTVLNGRYTNTDGTYFYGPLGNTANANSTSSVFSTHIINFMNYSNSTTYKTCLARSNTQTHSQQIVNMFFSTAVINRITFYFFSKS